MRQGNIFYKRDLFGRACIDTGAVNNMVGIEQKYSYGEQVGQRCRLKIFAAAFSFGNKIHTIKGAPEHKDLNCD